MSDLKRVVVVNGSSIEEMAQVATTESNSVVQAFLKVCTRFESPKSSVINGCSFRSFKLHHVIAYPVSPLDPTYVLSSGKQLLLFIFGHV